MSTASCISMRDCRIISPNTSGKFLNITSTFFTEIHRQLKLGSPSPFIAALSESPYGVATSAVVRDDQWLPDALMREITRENNVSETALLVRQFEGVFNARRFSPIMEIAFCRHATLASACVIFKNERDVRSVAPELGRLANAEIPGGGAIIELMHRIRNEQFNIAVTYI